MQLEDLALQEPVFTGFMMNLYVEARLSMSQSRTGFDRVAATDLGF